MRLALIVGAIVVVLIVLLRSILKTEDQLITKFAEAIAIAEGYFVTGSRPNRNNNPGNLKQDLIGKSIGTDGDFVKYATPEDGWNNLKAQIQKMLGGTSKFYNPSMTIQQIADIWTTTNKVEWARIVSNKLGVTTNTRLEDV